MKKTDFKKSLKHLYAPPADDFVEVDVVPMSFVKVDGAGDPNVADAYQLAVKSLYGVGYAMKFSAKAVLGRDYVVPPLEWLWWAADPNVFVKCQKEQWQWTMMLMVPDFVKRDMFDAGVAKTRAKLGALPDSLRFELFDEGRCLQIMHIGSYDSEGPTLARLHDQIMPERGLIFNGPHHEIYLSDPRRTLPQKLKTILRQPVRPLDGV